MTGGKQNYFKVSTLALKLWEVFEFTYIHKKFSMLFTEVLKCDLQDLCDTAKENLH